MKTKCKLSFCKTAVIAVLYFVFASNLFTQPQHYNFNAATGNNVFPFGIYASTGKTIQTLYLPNAFGNPTPAPSGNITKIYFQAVSTGSTTYTQLTIKMGQTTDTDLPAAWYTGSMTTVFSQSNYNITTTMDQFAAITLTTPFNYDPTKSLVVEITQCGYSGPGFGVRNTTLSGIKRNAGPGSASACPHSYFNNGGITTHTGIDVAPVNCTYTWGTNTSGTTNILQAVWTVNNNICWVAGGAGTVRRTTDGGTTWTNANPNPGVINGDIYNLWALDANTALVTTSPGATFIYRTTNGGTNWTQVFTQAGGFTDAIVMSNATTGYAYGDPVGGRWSLWKTVNGGATWDSTGMYLDQNASEAGWNNAMCVIGNNIWFGTNGTRVYHSTNGGATGSWTFGVTTGNVSTYGVWFTSPTDGICVGTIVQKTTNGGTTWVNAGSVGGAGNMTSIGGSGNNWWLTRGNNIYGSTDFGATWTGPGYTGTQALWGLNVGAGANCLAGWSVGATGTLIRLNGVPVAINDPSVNIPNQFMLEQNYPNPFNPSTVIKFSIPKSGNVKLVVSDILGKEVTVLFDGVKTAGNYQVEFDGSKLSSGIYFYSISSGEFKETKKMLLIK